MPIASISSTSSRKDGMVRRSSARPPTHPGACANTFCRRSAVSDVAKALGVSRQQLHRILAETAPISPEMALRIGKLCDNRSELWLRMQITYDSWHARQEMAGTLVHIPTAKAQPWMRARASEC
jgi:antitoxin HigA-1